MGCSPTRSTSLLVQQRRPVQQQANRTGFGTGGSHSQNALAVLGHVEQRRCRVQEIHLEEGAQRLHLGFRTQIQFRFDQLVAAAQKEKITLVVPANDPFHNVGKGEMGIQSSRFRDQKGNFGLCPVGRSRPVSV